MKTLITYSSHLVQIMTQKNPFFHIHHGPNVVMQITAGKRPERKHYLPTVFTDPMWKLLVDCWDQDPERRPDMGIVVRRLEAM